MGPTVITSPPHRNSDGTFRVIQRNSEAFCRFASSDSAGSLKRNWSNCIVQGFRRRSSLLHAPEQRKRRFDDALDGRAVGDRLEPLAKRIVRRFLPYIELDLLRDLLLRGGVGS